MSENFDRDYVAGLIESCAHTANDVAGSQFRMSVSERDSVNRHFDVSVDTGGFTRNIARLPDEMMRVFLQAAGGHIYAISHLIRNRVGPASVLALARTAIESMTSPHWISSGDDAIDRTTRVVWVNYLRLKSLSDASIGTEQIQQWRRELKSLIESSELGDQAPGKNTIRRSLLNTDERWEDYDYLHNYVHADASIYAADYLTHSLKPEGINERGIEGALFATVLLLETVNSVAKHRLLDQKVGKTLSQLCAEFGIRSDHAPG